MKEAGADDSYVTQIISRRVKPEKQADYEAWLHCAGDDTTEADRLLRDTAPDYQYYAVGTAVSNSRNEGRELIEPLAH